MCIPGNPRHPHPGGGFRLAVVSDDELRLVSMADDTALRETAFQFALDIADLCEEDVFCGSDVSLMTTQVIDAADRIFSWLAPADPVVQLVMDVGPVTEQP